MGNGFFPVLVAVRAIDLSKQKNCGDATITANMKGATSACMAGCFKFILLKAVLGMLRSGIGRIDCSDALIERGFGR